MRRPKRFNVGDNVFLNVPPTEARTADERAAETSKSNLGPRTDGPFKVIQVFENVVVVDEYGIRVPISINRYTRAPPPCPTPLDPNTRLDGTDEPRFVDDSNDVKDSSRPNAFHEDAT